MTIINMGMNIGMTMDMSMTFHTKQSNLSRPKQTRPTNTTTTTTSSTTSLSSSISTNTNLMFQSPMIDRVVKAKSGCSACGR